MVILALVGNNDRYSLRRQFKLKLFGLAFEVGFHYVQPNLRLVCRVGTAHHSLSVAINGPIKEIKGANKSSEWPTRAIEIPDNDTYKVSASFPQAPAGRKVYSTREPHVPKPQRGDRCTASHGRKHEKPLLKCPNMTLPPVFQSRFQLDFVQN